MKTDMTRSRHWKALFAVSSALLGAVALGGQSAAQPNTSKPQPSSEANGSPLDRQENVAAKQADAWFENYRFRDGETIARVRIHYATLGSPNRDARGDIDNAVLVLHWTGADGRVLLTPTYMKALFDPGRALDAHRYFLIFPDNVGHGQSSKPSDGLKAEFPNYGYGDIVDLQHRLVAETLGIKHLRASSASRWAA